MNSHLPTVMARICDDTWRAGVNNMARPGDVANLVMERDRLRTELANVNNEFGSQTADWPDAWQRVAEIKRLAGERWAKIEELQAAQTKVYDLVQDMIQARGADNESGAHWLNNLAADEWAKKNKSLLDAMNKLINFVYEWGPA